MLRLIPLLLLVCHFGFSQPSIPSFPLERNDLAINRPAQPSQYFDKIGKRAALMGYESGTFEAWVWPWKVLRNFELSFVIGTSTQPILAREIVRTISATPEATTITYTHESFTVRNIFLVPRNEPGIIQLLEIDTTVPLTIISSFIPVLQPMWPAGIGGQFSYWDDQANAYVISEGQWRAIFLSGSPAAKQIAAPPAHMFADAPLQFSIEIKPEDTEDRFIPIVIAGGGMSMDSVKAVYARLWNRAYNYYQQNHDYYKELRKSTLRISTGHREFDLALEWGKVALDNLMIHNPTLGYGMVAGFGLSGGSARPGFAWFFGGDAFINSLAMNSYGAHQSVRDALAFTQQWQRQENFPIRKQDPLKANADAGKMAHELSQSDGLCDWWNDYHYGYNHADTTPWYLIAMGDYVRTSRDTAFLRRSWNSVRQAYDWCVRKDSDADGLMDLKGAGLGALEFGKLVGIYADVYTCGVWVQGIKEMIMMAELMNDSSTKSLAETQLAKAQPALEKKFWIDDLGYYSYGATEKGEQVRELTPWPGVAMMFGLFNEQRTRKGFLTMNGADLCTDWGVRSLARSSSLFDPTNYNYGAVWPFIASFFNTAQFKHDYGLSGFQILASNIQHAFDHGIGVVPEVFSGELNEKLGEAYHHQGFSTTGYIVPLLRGLLGLHVNALENSVTLSPSLPADWTNVQVENVRVGDRSYNFTFLQSDTTFSVTVSSQSQHAVNLILSPLLPKGMVPGLATVNGQETHDLHFELLKLRFEVRDGDRIDLRYFGQRPAIIPRWANLEPGTRNSSLRIISHSYDPDRWNITRLLVEGLPGETYTLAVENPERLEWVHGARLEGNHIIISFDKEQERSFRRKEVLIKRR
jgi:glycogen debranching enzyme